MLQDTKTLNVPGSQTQGTPTDVANLVDKWIQVEGIAGGGQLRPQGRVRSGGAFANLGSSAISADGIYEIPEGITEIRIDRTVVGSGTPVVTLFGRASWAFGRVPNP